MVVKLLNGATISLQGFPTINNEIGTMDLLSEGAQHTNHILNCIVFQAILHSNCRLGFCIQIAGLKGIVWRLPIRRVVDWNNPIICDLKLFSMADPFWTWTRSFQVVQAKGWRLLMDYQSPLIHLRMFLAQKTLPLRDTGTLILVVPSCGLNFVEATRRLSRIEFQVEIKPELLRTSPFYQFYPCN